jgi:hypothetical protein
VYRPEPVAFFAVHRLDFIKPRRSEPNHCTGGSMLTPSPHSPPRNIQPQLHN